MTSLKPLKAYQIEDVCGESSDIVFGRFNAEARRKGASIIGDGDWDSVECHRAPTFDAFAPGPVPEEVKWERGWWFYCCRCERRCSGGDGSMVASRAYCTDHPPQDSAP